MGYHASFLKKLSQIERKQSDSGAFWGERTESGHAFCLLASSANKIRVWRMGHQVTPTHFLTNFFWWYLVDFNYANKASIWAIKFLDSPTQWE